ncbi:MAG: TVP38/TMEM64 family protein [Alphaproteobacteria bacterium]|nr:TVP38/TMEM64 family protein [Alphaproteobacteria bacterium]
MLGTVALAAVVLALRAPIVQDALAHVASAAHDAGPAGLVVFVLIYALATVAALPVSLLTVGAGVAWGPVVGLAVVWPGAVAGATLAFVLGRTVLRTRVAPWVADHPRLARLDDRLAARGGWVVFLLRLSPVVPFNALNYALGLTRIGLGTYALATAVGILPGTAMYVYLGAIGHASGDTRTPAQQALFWAGLAATVAVTVVVTRLARAALDPEADGVAPP